MTDRGTRVRWTTAALIAEQDADAREAGVGGVPFFVFDGRLAVSGAQGADRLTMALDKAWAKGAETSPG